MYRVKDSLTTFLIIIFICHEIQEFACLSIKNFHVPASVTTGSQVFLICEIEMGKDRLVNLKWYFNDQEFLRFEPKSIREETQIFQLPTLNLAKSSVLNSADRGSKIFINSVDKDMSGKYKCEVTIESQFFTINKEKYMEVVRPPTTTSTAQPPYTRFFPPKAKSLDLENLADNITEEVQSHEVLNNGCSTIIRLNWLHILNLMLIAIMAYLLCIERF